MKLKKTIFMIGILLVGLLILFAFVLSYKNKSLDKDMWVSLVLEEEASTDYYEHLLRYGRPQIIEEKLSDIGFLDALARFLVKELYGDFRIDYSISIDKGESVLFIFEESIKNIPDFIGEEKVISFVLEKKTGKILATSMSKY